MVNLDLVGQQQPASEKQIQDFEKEIGYPLPEDYRDFLLSINGGRSKTPQVVRIEDCNDDVMVDVFLSIGPPVDISRHMSVIAEEIPKGFIIFAKDPGGNKFIMDMSSGEPTTVYYWDRQRHFRRSKKKANTYQIAVSFTEFLGMLRPFVRDK